MQRVEDRVAVVTGAAAGIGLGIARAFSAAGMKVVLADVRDEPLEQAAAELRDSGGQAIAVCTDVTRLDEVEALAAAALAEFGAVQQRRRGALQHVLGLGAVEGLPRVGRPVRHHRLPRLVRRVPTPPESSQLHHRPGAGEDDRSSQRLTLTGRRPPRIQTTTRSHRSDGADGFSRVLSGLVDGGEASGAVSTGAELQMSPVRCHRRRAAAE